MSDPRQIIALSPGCPWAGWAPPDIQHCEQNVCGWITTPANTWSNLAYLAAAWWIWRRHRDHPAARWLAPVAALVGATSFFFHASFTAAGQYADYAGMFLYVLLLLSLNAGRLGFRRRGRIYAAAVAVSCAALPLLRAWAIGLQWLIVLQVAAVVATELVLSRRPGPSYRPWLAAMGLMAAAASLWVLDYTRAFCDPGDHFFQGHAGWHVLSALAIPFLADFYRDAA